VRQRRHEVGIEPDYADSRRQIRVNLPPVKIPSTDRFVPRTDGSALTPKRGGLTLGQGLNFTATVTNDVGAAGVTWSATGGGTFSNTTATTATYSAPGTAGTVTVSWARADDTVEIRVVDSGPGLSGTANLFVPFYTTKANGSGIGLVLCRQIAEAHGGTLTLADRADTRGCVAVVRLPAV